VVGRFSFGAVVLLMAALALVGGGLWVRLAPVDPMRWHVDPERAPDPGPGGYRSARDFAARAETVLAAFDRIARADARTRRIAGTPGEGRLTYESRSRFWGFPDYTTVSARPGPGGRGSRLVVLGRLRFGRGDLGVNRRRIEGWIKELVGIVQ